MSGRPMPAKARQRRPARSCRASGTSRARWTGRPRARASRGDRLAGAPSPITTRPPTCGHCRAQRRPQRARREGQAVADARRRHRRRASARSFVRLGFCSPSSITMTSAPCATQGAPRPTRSRDTTVGPAGRGAAARRRPPRPPWRAGSTTTGPAQAAAVAAGDRKAGARPSSRSRAATAIARGRLAGPAEGEVAQAQDRAARPRAGPVHAPGRERPVGAPERRQQARGRMVRARPESRRPHQARASGRTGQPRWRRCELHLRDEGVEHRERARHRALEGREGVLSGPRHRGEAGRRRPGGRRRSRPARRRRRPRRRRRRDRGPGRPRRNSRCGGRAAPRVSRRTGSIGFWPPCGTSEPPRNTRGLRR